MADSDMPSPGTFVSSALSPFSETAAVSAPSVSFNSPTATCRVIRSPLRQISVGTSSPIRLSATIRGRRRILSTRLPSKERITSPGSMPAFSAGPPRPEEHTSELQSLMSISYAAFCLKHTNHQLPVHTNKRIHTKHYCKAHL